MSRFLAAGPLLLLVACGQQQPAATAAPGASIPDTSTPRPQPVAPVAPDDARTPLLMLAPYVAQLAQAQALQADAQVQQLSKTLLTQATGLEQGPATASLKPTMLALTQVLEAAQQKAYPTLAAPTHALAAEARQLSGQPATADDKRKHYQFVTHASDLLKQFIAQTPGLGR